MEDYVAAVRAIFTAFQEGGPLRHEGPHYRLTRFQPEFNPGPLPTDGPLPIWLGGVNRRACRLAGAVGDGYVTHPTNSDRRYLGELCLPALEEGLSEAGRDRSEVQVVVGGMVATGRDDAAVAEARTRSRYMLGFLFSTPAYRRTLELHGWEDLGDQLRSMTKEGRWEDLEATVTDEVLDTVVAAGRYDQLAQVLGDRYADLADGVLLHPPPTPPTTSPSPKPSRSSKRSDPRVAAGRSTAVAGGADGSRRRRVSRRPSAPTPPVATRSSSRSSRPDRSAGDRVPASGHGGGLPPATTAARTPRGRLGVGAGQASVGSLYQRHSVRRGRSGVPRRPVAQRKSAQASSVRSMSGMRRCRTWRRGRRRRRRGRRGPGHVVGVGQGLEHAHAPRRPPGRACRRCPRLGPRVGADRTTAAWTDAMERQTAIGRRPPPPARPGWCSAGPSGERASASNGTWPGRHRHLGGVVEPVVGQVLDGLPAVPVEVAGPRRPVRVPAGVEDRNGQLGGRHDVVGGDGPAAAWPDPRGGS